MLTNTGPVAKLYLSIIDDVIESMRELFLDEGIEDRVLDDLRHLWETKMMQSKAMDDFRKNNINSSNFVLQLPAAFTHKEQDLSASVVMPPAPKAPTFSTLKTNSETVATFSLPAGLTYPVQIPAGVTLQTASGQLYKVNVPVVVTQAPAGPQSLLRPPPKAPPPAPAPVTVRISTSSVHEGAPSALPKPTTVLQASKPNTNPVRVQEPVPQPPPVPVPVPVPEIIDLDPDDDPESPSPPAPEDEDDEEEDQPVNLSMNPSPPPPSIDFQMSATSDIDDILKEVIEKEREKFRNSDVASAEDVLGLDLDYSALSDIVQLDGAADSEDDVTALDDNDFLGMINAEAMKALQEGGGSSDGNSFSSSDSDEEDKLAHVEDEDPLNSGDDVTEQDIPDLFDTDNVIVCQYDKIHRSKNRWKFHLKDGVMTYGGRDYVFSKAVGEAEW